MDTIFDLSHTLPSMKQRTPELSKHEEEEEEEEGGAKCLMLLSHGGARFKPMNQPQTRVYECKSCNRCFASFQALGGHRASHKKARTAGECVKNSNNNNLKSSEIKPKVHGCSICGSEFSIGQALGGHMRRHRTSVGGVSHASHVVKKASSGSRRFLCIDLNFPPLENGIELYS